MIREWRFFKFQVTFCVLWAVLLWTGCPESKREQAQWTQGEYTVRVLVLTGSSLEADEITGHFRQSWNLVTQVHVQDKFPDLSELKGYDCIYICSSLVQAHKQDLSKLRGNLTRAATGGVLIYLEPGCAVHGLGECIGMRDPMAVTEEEAVPIFMPFPVMMRSLESFFKGCVPASGDSARTQYEKTHLPAFVVTQPEFATWPVRVKAGVKNATTLIRGINGSPLAVWRSMGRGGIFWTADFSRREETFHGISVRRDFSFGFPDPAASNFHFGRAGMDFLLRDLLVDLAAKLKYGLSIRRVFGPNGAPCLSWQNHLDAYDNWTSRYAIRWSDLLLKQGLIASFTVRSDLTQFDRQELKDSRAGAEAFVHYCKARGIPVNLHLTFEPVDSPETEMSKINADVARLVDLGVSRDDITGGDHHVFYTHAKPVWQSAHSMLQAGLYHDFGGATLSNFDLFPYFFCTSAAYFPFAPPFLMEKAPGEWLPFVVGSPAPARPFSAFSSNRYALPGSLRLPVDQYFHPEFIFQANTLEELHPEFQDIIRQMIWLRDEQGYCPVTEPQAARAILANRTAEIRAEISPEKIRIVSDGSMVFEQAGNFKTALGVRIEWAGSDDFLPPLRSDGLVQHITAADGSLETSLNPSGLTVIQRGNGMDDPFRLDRVNVPFDMRQQGDTVHIRITEPGLRWLRWRLNCSTGGQWLPDPGVFSIQQRHDWLEVSHCGDAPLDLAFKFWTGDLLTRKLTELLNGKKTVSPVQVIDFGTSTARKYLGRGWCINDEIIGGRTVIWSSGYLFSELTVPLNNNALLMCALDVMPYGSGNGHEQTLSIRVNGEVIREGIKLTSGWQTVRFKIPKKILIQGDNKIQFKYASGGFPGLDIPGCLDFRFLSVMFDRLIFSSPAVKGKNDK